MSKSNTMKSSTTSHTLDVSRRSFLRLVIATGGTAAAASALPTTAAAAETPTAYPEKFTFAVMSDVHYLSPDLIAKNASYEIAENSDRKMFSESADILDRALDVIVEQAPDMVIVPGDLTKDGEHLCHEQVSERYRHAQEAILEATGKQTKFYVINGNHDLNNHHAKDFKSAGAEDTVAPDAQRTDPTEYKTGIWADFGYAEATAFFDKDGTRDGSLSYVVRPCPGLTLIVVDSCSYNLDGGDGTLAQETQDGMTQELVNWVCEQAKAAKAAGDVVVAMQHHGIVEHFGYEDEIFGEYLVNKNLGHAAVAEAYADAGISAVFTGHMHANDIAAHTSAAGNTIYDIETGSLVTYPSHIRLGSFEFVRKGDELECTMTVDDQPLDTVDFAIANPAGLTDVAEADITAYGKERTLTVESVQTMLGSMFVEPVLAQYAPQGIKAILVSLLPMLGDQFTGVTEDTVDESLWSLVLSLIPSAKDVTEGLGCGITLSVSILDICIFYNTTNQRIEAWRYNETSKASDANVMVLSLTPEQEAAVAEAVQPYAATTSDSDAVVAITAESFSAFVDSLATELDAKALSAEGQATLLSIVNLLVANLLTHPIDADQHDVLGLVDFAYQDHLLGCEQSADWATSAIAGIEENQLLETAVAAALNTTLTDEELTTFATSITLDLDSLLVKTTNGIGSLLVIPTIKKMLGNLGLLLDTLQTTMELDLGATVGGLVPSIELFGEPVPQLAAGALETLSTDTNVADDHHLVATATATIPVEEKPSKNELQDTIGSAEKVETEGASSSAVQEFEAALAAARAVMSDPDATEAEISAARARLANAIKAVEESKAQGGQDGNGGNGNGGSTSGKPSGGKLIGTGDASMVASLAALLAGGGTIAAGIWARMSGRGGQE